MKNLLIVRKEQFGYQIDIYKWCQYLHDKYVIDVICVDSDKGKYEMDNVHVHYVKATGNKIIRGTRFLLCCIWQIARFHGIVLISFFQGCQYIKKVLFWKKMVLDIRTFSVAPDENTRKKENKILMEAVRNYDFVTVISEGLRKQLPKEHTKTSVLPLGADIIETSEKQYKTIELLYVGTFYNRNLEKTIEGLALAKEKLGDSVALKYHIVGKGFYGEEEVLKNTVASHNLADCVIFYGYQPHDKLKFFYEKCNIGVSFVPITPYYDYQPVTKTFEYIMAGLFTIATATESNKEIITDENGLLIDDTPESFANAIDRILEIKGMLNSNHIRHSLDEYQWNSIINNRMVHILEDFYKQENYISLE